jgi:hypothetical protein
LYACDSQKVLVKNGGKKNKDYEVGEYHSGCCGCYAVYYSLFENNKIKQQFIAELTCGFGYPTIFRFEKASTGELLTQRYVAVGDSAATQKFNDKEKMLIAKLDSIAAYRVNNSDRTKLAGLTGYMPAPSDKYCHPFWIDEKGKTRVASSY